MKRFAVESAATRICREAGGRVKVNVFIKDTISSCQTPMMAETGGSRLKGLSLFVGALQSVGTVCVGGKQGEWHSWKKTDDLCCKRERNKRGVAWRSSIFSCAETRAKSLSSFGPGVDKMVQAIDDVIADHKHADGSTARVVV